MSHTVSARNGNGSSESIGGCTGGFGSESCRTRTSVIYELKAADRTIVTKLYIAITFILTLCCFAEISKQGPLLRSMDMIDLTTTRVMTTVTSNVVPTTTSFESTAVVTLETKAEEKKWSDVKLAIYMTTHLPKKHQMYLPCWNDAVQRMEIFKYADLILYTARQPTMSELEMLPFRNVIVKVYNNTSKQGGAIQAMIDPFVDKVTWFDEYDWVIRLNPDVLIRKDTWLIQTMLDPNMNAIFHDCADNGTANVKLHTDFYAFRPIAIDRELVLRSNNTNAEYHMTEALWNIYQSKQFAYLEGAAHPRKGMCRIVGVNSPVIHAHGASKACPYYYNATNTEVYSKEKQDGLYL
jgi:hypothetical protein